MNHDSTWTTLRIQTQEQDVQCNLFIDGLFTNAVEHAKHGAFLNAKGKFIAEAVIVSANKESILLCTPIYSLSDLTEHITHYALLHPLTLTPHTHSVVRSMEKIKGTHAFRDPRHQGLGWWSLADYKKADTPTQHWSITKSRYLIGVAEGENIPPKSIILHYNFDKMQSIAWEKGCYLGQELITRTRFTGSINKRIFAITGKSLHPTCAILDQSKNSIGSVLVAHNNIGLGMCLAKPPEGLLFSDGSFLGLTPFSQS